jgi:hypothetical protein
MLANHEGLTSKCVSVAHFEASKSKVTAGALAARLRKKGIQITAKFLIQESPLILGYYPEWHHSGFYKTRSGQKMGKTYFFDPTEQGIVIRYYFSV